MPDTTYSIEYTAPAAKINRDLDQIEARLKRFDATVDKSIAKLKTLGSDITGITKFQAALAKLDVELQHKVVNAGNAAIALAAVGKDNRALTGLTAKLHALEAQLKAVTTASGAAKTGMAGFGSNVPIHVDRGTKSVESFGASLLALNAGMFAVRKVTEALDAMGESAVKAREFQDQGSQSGLDKRGKAREYANLTQHDGPDDVVMSRLFGLARAGGYKFDDALKYGEQFLGSSPAGVQAGHVTEAQLSMLEKEGARFANRVGLDPATGGDLAGVIPQYTDLTKDANGRVLSTDEGVRKAMGQLGALQYGLNEGRGKISTLARSELGAASAALAAGRISDHAEMGSFVGIASTFTKTASSSGTAFKQMDALINNAEVDPGSDQKGDYLRRIGVAGAKGDFEKLRMLKRDIDAQRAKDPNLDVLSFLTSKGFASREERASTAAFVQNFDVLEKRRDEARRRAGRGQDVINANRQYGFSLEGQNQLGDAASEQAEYEQIQRHQRTSIARKFALADLRKENKIDTTASNFEDWALDFVSNGAGIAKMQQWSGAQSTAAASIDTRVRENLIKGALKAGVDLEKTYPGFAKGYGEVTNWTSTIDKVMGEGTSWTLDQVMQDVGPLMERAGVGLNGEGGDGGRAPANRKLKIVMPPSQRSAFGIPSVAELGVDSGGGSGSIVEATRQVGEKIDRQTNAIVGAIRGGGRDRGAPANAFPDFSRKESTVGDGIYPGRP